MKWRLLHSALVLAIALALAAIASPLDPSKLSRVFLRPAIQKAGITKPFRVFHDLRHTAITHDAAAGNPRLSSPGRNTRSCSPTPN